MNGLQNAQESLSPSVQSVSLPIGTERKRCPKCGEIKNHDEFYFRKKYDKGRIFSRCKMCTKSDASLFSQRNPLRRKEIKKRWVEKNRERVKEKNREWYSTEKGKKSVRSSQKKLSNSPKGKLKRLKWREKNKESIKEKNRLWRATGKGKASTRNHNKKARSSVKGKIRTMISGPMRQSLKNVSKLGRHWEDLVGFTVEQLKRHIERKFKPGMSWDNYGSYWEIDHIIPIAAFNYETPEDIDFKRCWCLKNLQPLEKSTNRKKWKHLDKPFQPAFVL